MKLYGGGLGKRLSCGLGMRLSCGGLGMRLSYGGMGMRLYCGGMGMRLHSYMPTKDTDVDIILGSVWGCAEVGAGVFVVQVMHDFTDWLIQTEWNTDTFCCPSSPTGSAGSDIGAHQSQPPSVAHIAVIIFIRIVGSIWIGS